MSRNEEAREGSGFSAILSNTTAMSREILMFVSHKDSKHCCIVTMVDCTRWSDHRFTAPSARTMSISMHCVSATWFSVFMETDKYENIRRRRHRLLGFSFNILCDLQME